MRTSLGKEKYRNCGLTKGKLRKNGLDRRNTKVLSETSDGSRHLTPTATKMLRKKLDVS